MIGERLQPHSLIFGDLYQLLDAVMLAGAEMAMGKGESRQARISISRGKHNRRLLFWYMVILHSHGVDLRIRGMQSIIRNGSVTLSSQHSPLLVRAYERWYRNAGKRLPLDVHADKQTVSVMLAGPLKRWAARGKDSLPLRIMTPPCHPMSLANLTNQVHDHLPVMDTKFNGRHGQIMVRASDAIDFIDGMVPSSVWSKR